MITGVVWVVTTLVTSPDALTFAFIMVPWKVEGKISEATKTAVHMMLLVFEQEHKIHAKAMNMELALGLMQAFLQHAPQGVDALAQTHPEVLEIYRELYGEP